MLEMDQVDTPEFGGDEPALEADDYVAEEGEREMMLKDADKPRMADRLADAQRKADEHNEGIGDDVSKARQEPQL